MEFEEMLSVLKRINEENDKPVPYDTLEMILALVLKKPLDSDRGKCQEQIMAIINQRVERG